MKFTAQPFFSLFFPVELTWFNFIELTSHKIRFQIEDTGIGIAANNFAEIFTPFVQLNGGVKKYEGTGLGLTISQNIIRLMGSQIQLKSEVDRGSKFWFDLELLEVETNLTTNSSELSLQQ